MTAARLDVLALGDAVVDVIAGIDDDFLAREDVVKGSMRLIDAAEAARLYARMRQPQEISGGSAANTMAGIAALGGKAAFVGQVANDPLGAVFARDMRGLGVEFETRPLAGEIPTGRCLILVTPDAQRTMNTFGGASHRLSPEALDEAQIRDAAILYLEAYLWVPDTPRAAMERAAAIARAAGRAVALTLSDVACIMRAGGHLRRLIDDGAIDLLFANEEEIKALAGVSDVDAAIASVKDRVPLLVVTRGEKGALAVGDFGRVAVEAKSAARVVDTTGAGDLFAAGFLTGRAHDRPLAECLRMGTAAAAEVISQYGARPRADLKTKVLL